MTCGSQNWLHSMPSKVPVPETLPNLLNAVVDINVMHASMYFTLYI